MLFCNSQQSARFVDHTLREDGYKTANYHGAVPANERAANYKAFLRSEAHILVTTDLAARGLDQLDVSHVVQFDFAKSAADYVHRCGRTARAGKRGTVTSLVTKSDTELVRAPPYDLADLAAISMTARAPRGAHRRRPPCGVGGALPVIST